MSEQFVSIPLSIAQIIDGAFLPANPNKLRGAVPEVVAAAKHFKDALRSHPVADAAARIAELERLVVAVRDDAMRADNDLCAMEARAEAAEAELAKLRAERDDTARQDEGREALALDPRALEEVNAGLSYHEQWNTPRETREKIITTYLSALSASAQAPAQGGEAGTEDDGDNDEWYSGPQIEEISYQERAAAKRCHLSVGQWKALEHLRETADSFLKQFPGTDSEIALAWHTYEPNYSWPSSFGFSSQSMISLVRRGLATRPKTSSFCITPAGRAMLPAAPHPAGGE